MAVYRYFEVDIPKERVTIEKQKNGKPALIKYVLQAPYDREKGYARPQRTTIGHQVPGSTTKMHPTSQYADIFPFEWAKISKERIKPVVKNIGMFTAIHAINRKIGIKDILDNVYGTDKASAIVDYAMYSIIHHTDDAAGFAHKMRNELLFSYAPYSDTWYSRLFEEEMTRELELLFRKRWALQCKEDGVECVWLCIDGSNDDCQSKGVDIAEKGHAKSGKNINIVSFTYAVTEDGKPVTYDVYRGGLVDAKAMQKIIDFLSECGIGIRGVILDRGYCDASAIKYLIKKELAYVIMVKGHPEGYEKLVKEYGARIKMNAEYLIPHTYLFGYQKQIQLFKNFKHQDYLTLFFDYKNGSERITTLLTKLYQVMDSAEDSIIKGIKPTIDAPYNDMLMVTEENHDDQTVYHIKINASGLQEAIDEKGLYSIVTSDHMSPEEVHRLYSCRGVSETQYMQTKTQLGYGVTRVQYTQGVRARFSVGFIASVIRHEIEQAAKPLDRNVNQMVQELEKIEAQKINDVYTYTHTETIRQKNFFKELGADLKTLVDESVQFENDRLAGRTPTPRRRKPGPQKGSHHKKYDEQGNIIPRKSGVKSGTKRSDTNKDGTPRKKPGVKQGTKRGTYNKDGSLRKKPGPKVKSI